MPDISPELSRLVAGAGGMSPPRGATPAAAAAPGNTPPPGGPMATPQPKAGLQQASMASISAVFKLLEKSLPAFTPTSAEYKAILGALKTLTAAFGKSRQEGDAIMPAELMRLIASQPGAAGAGGAGAVAKMPPMQPATPPPGGA